jgi:hypothetical protein
MIRTDWDSLFVVRGRLLIRGGTYVVGFCGPLSKKSPDLLMQGMGNSCSCTEDFVYIG